MRIGELARSDVVTVPLDASLVTVAETMRDAGVGSVVVMDAGKPRGIVTDRDLVVYGLADDADPTSSTAKTVMEEDLFTVDVNQDVFTTTVEMRERAVRRVPVLDDGSLAGIITLDDLLVVLAEELAALAAVIEAEFPPR
jgi:signal-transduction protein with cAMP-binding, CBS, and nucleotidyltransferase domain